MAKKSKIPAVLVAEKVSRHILLIRGEKVILDRELAALYGVTTGALNQAVKRNSERFPADFMFQLTWDEVENQRSQIVIFEKKGNDSTYSVSGREASKSKPKYRPNAFTEQGVAMLSSVLKSPRAAAVNVEIMRAFVRLREILNSHADLARKMDALEKRYDSQFRIVFDAIRELMTPDAPPKRKQIGFRVSEETSSVASKRTKSAGKGARSHQVR